MPNTKNGLRSFTIRPHSGNNCLIPIDPQYSQDKYSAVVETPLGFTGRLTRTGGFTEDNGCFSFPVTLEYLIGDKKGEKQKCIVVSYRPKSRFGQLIFQTE